MQYLRLALVVCCLLAICGSSVFASSLSSPSARIEMGRFDAGGGVRMSSAAQTQDTIGTWVIGTASSPNAVIDSNLFRSSDVRDSGSLLYLPLVER